MTRCPLQYPLSCIFIAYWISNTPLASTNSNHDIQGLREDCDLGKRAKSRPVSCLQFTPALCSFIVKEFSTLVSHRDVVMMAYKSFFAQLQVISYAYFIGLIHHGSGIRQGEA